MARIILSRGLTKNCSLSRFMEVSQGYGFFFFKATELILYVEILYQYSKRGNVTSKLISQGRGQPFACPLGHMGVLSSV